ncbi:Glutamate 5-kinase [Porphyridium purpureum]|uniref:Glutamate 5-kinase n=1 Tax=Porphyridium purpureum TaxID=35688 RepID=A0A5J4YX92_PORPP|nr:Glutamate 5-kinase [Porphyridium purpureum]|eukprot:POR4650..scf209_3
MSEILPPTAPSSGGTGRSDKTILGRSVPQMTSDSESDIDNVRRNQSLAELTGFSHEPDTPTVVIKVGTSTIMRESSPASDSVVTASSVAEAAGMSLDADEGELAISTLALLTDTILTLKRGGFGVVLVTSGAVGMGCREMGITQRPDSLAAKQALAAVGQLKLMQAYADLFRLGNQPVAQVLLSRTDFTQKHQYFNARNTLMELLKLGVIPIVNENDTVATEELRFGDNDSLSAFVAGLVSAKWLFLLTDVDQLYTDNPRNNPDAEPIAVVKNIEELDVGFGQSGKGGTQWGTGGMITKIVAARLATAAGVTVCVSHGRHPHRILDFVMNRGEMCGTVFIARSRKAAIRKGRKRWIAQGLVPRGKIWIDDGAVRAIRMKKSLFPVGVRKVEGSFESNNSITVLDLQDREVACGISNFSRDECEMILGKHSDEVNEILGYHADEELIHRGNLVVFKMEDC